MQHPLPERLSPRPPKRTASPPSLRVIRHKLVANYVTNLARVKGEYGQEAEESGTTARSSSKTPGAKKMKIPLRRETRVHDSPPTSPLAVETGVRAIRHTARTTAPSSAVFAPSLGALLNPPGKRVSRTHVGIPSIASSNRTRERRSPSPSGTVAASPWPRASSAPSQASLDSRHERARDELAPPQSYEALREYGVGEVTPAERRPMDLIPEIEPRNPSNDPQGHHRVPAVSPAPSIRDLPPALAPPLRGPSIPAPGHPLPPAFQPSLQQSRAFGIDRILSLVHPFVRRRTGDIRPHAMLVSLDADEGHPTQRVQGFPFPLPRYRLDFTHALECTLTSGTTVIVAGPQGLVGELVLIEELDIGAESAHLLGYRVWDRRSFACVVDVAADCSEVLSRYEVFRGFEYGVNPVLAYRDILHATTRPERWEHVFAHTRMYTIERFLREMGREDILACVPDELWGIFVAPPEGQYLTTALLYAASGVPPHLRGPKPAPRGESASTGRERDA
ncbi:uncharacterized protein SCHCODRAFT_02667511 [Schizophyllum commune H4-8]|nr:uncharacterized protein SCHCODRAFT_02667511 [Schizophyllum commune H4-8]KAI5891950.1 hypothetical protein SCHCODRAFT_02667511 [Schizophyllum commune H4-8]